MLSFWKIRERDVVELFQKSYGPDAEFPHLYNWGKADAGAGVPNHDNGVEGYNPTIKKAIEKKQRVITEAVPIFISHTHQMSVASEKKGFVDQPRVPSKHRFTLWRQAHTLSKGQGCWWLRFLTVQGWHTHRDANGATMIFMPMFKHAAKVAEEHNLQPGQEVHQHKHGTPFACAWHYPSTPMALPLLGIR